MKTIIYIWNGKTWRKKAFNSESKALAFINKHNIVEYEDEFGYRTYII